MCVCGGVKVGYSLLLGHVANPLTPGLDPAPRPLQQQQTHFSLTASRTRIPVSKCTGSPEKLSHSGNTQTAARPSVPPPPPLPPPPKCHPTDVFFSSLSPNSVPVTTVIIVVVMSVMSQRVRLLSQSCGESSDATDVFFAFG